MSIPADCRDGAHLRRVDLAGPSQSWVWIGSGCGTDNRDATSLRRRCVCRTPALGRRANDSHRIISCNRTETRYPQFIPIP